MAFPPVDGIKDGERLEDDVLNRPINQLRERTDFLNARVNDIAGVIEYYRATSQRGRPASHQ
jgi:hypothetical protein